MSKIKKSTEVQSYFLSTYDKSNDKSSDKQAEKPQPQVIEETIIEEKTELEKWQDKINREWENINKEETAILILAKNIKEKKKHLQDEQEKLWNEQKMPLLQILANLDKKEILATLEKKEE